MANWLTRIFGSRNQRLISQYNGIVRKINAFEQSLQALSDTELAAKTPQFREQLVAGTDSEAPERNPLQPDALTDHARHMVNTPGFENFAGRIDAQGRASARLGPFPAGVLAPWLGRSLHVVVGVRDRLGVTYSSPQPLRVVD